MHYSTLDSTETCSASPSSGSQQLAGTCVHHVYDHTMPYVKHRFALSLPLAWGKAHVQYSAEQTGSFIAQCAVAVTGIAWCPQDS